MNGSTRQNSFELEALEPRVLLSGDTLFIAAAAANAVTHKPLEVAHHESATGQHFQGSLNYNPATEAGALFEGVSAQPIHTPATDSKPVQATPASGHDQSAPVKNSAPAMQQNSTAQATISSAPSANVRNANGTLPTTGTISSQSVTTRQLTATLKAANGPPASVAVSQIASNKSVTKNSNASNSSKTITSSPAQTTSSQNPSDIGDIFGSILTNIGLVGQSGFQATIGPASGTLDGILSFQGLSLTFNLNSGGTAVTSVSFSATSASMALGGAVTASVGAVTGTYTPGSGSTGTFQLTLNEVDSSHPISINLSSFVQITATSASLTYAAGTNTTGTINYFNTTVSTTTNSSGQTVQTVTNTLASATDPMSYMTIGISGGSIFAGVNGPATNTNAEGVSITSVNLALAIVHDTASSGTYVGSTFFGVSENGGSVSVVGLPTGFQATASNIAVNVNGAVNSSGTLTSSLSTPYWLNFDSTFVKGTGLAVSTGSGTINLDYQQQEIQASATMTLNFDNFVYISGNFTFLSGGVTTANSGNNLVLTDGTQNTTMSSVLEIGGSDVNVFVGVNGPPAPIGTSTNSIGVELSYTAGVDDTSFALALVTGSDGTVYYGLTVNGGIFTPVGLPSNFQLTTSNFEVNINGTSGSGASLNFGSTFNYANPGYTSTNGQPTTLPGLDVTINSTSGAAIPVNFTTPLVQGVGTVTINFGGFIYVSGNIGFLDGTPSGTPDTLVTTSGGPTGTTLSSVLEIAGNGLTIFAGVGGPSGNSATGIQLTNANFALALVTASDNKVYYGFAESGGTFSVVGLPSDFTMSVSDLAVSINGTSGGSYALDFDSTFGAGTGLVIPTGYVTTNGVTSMTSMNLDVNSPLTAISGNVDIQISSFLTLTGGFSYSESSSTINIVIGTAAFTGATELTLTLGSGSSAFFTATGSLNMTITSTATTITSASVTIQKVGNNPGLDIPGIIDVTTPTITLTNIAINNSTGQITSSGGGVPGLTLTAASATLFPGNSSITASVTPSTGTGADGLGFQATFNLQTGAFNITLEQFALTVGNVLTANASGVVITYSPSDGSNQQLVSIGNATVTFNSFSGGSDGAFTGNVTNLIIYGDGFRFDSLTLGYTGTIKLGSVLTLTDPSVTLTGFSVIFGDGNASFDETGSLTLSVASGSLTIGSIGASVTNLSATIGLSSATLGDVTASADELDVHFSSFLDITASDISINTNPDNGADYFSVGTATVVVTVTSSFTIGGSASNFSVVNNNGSPEFVAGTDFSVSLTVPSPSQLGLPNWLGFSITDFEIKWPSFGTDPTNFQLTLSASIGSIQGLPSGVQVQGTISDVIINVGELGSFLSNPSSSNFPISFGPDGGIGGSVTGTMFGMGVTATFVGGIVSFNAEGGIVNGTTVVGPGQGDTTIYGSGFYVGIQGSAAITGIGTVSMSLGFSSMGPLSFYLSYTGETPLILDPNSGLAIAGFSAGVAFNQTLGTPTTATDLPGIMSGALLAITGSSTGSAQNVDVSQWQQQLELATAAQYLATSGGTNLTAEYTQPFLILASVTLDDAYLTPNAIQITGQMVLGINPNAGPGQAPVTVLVEGSVILGGSSALNAANAYLYASISSSSASLMFLVNEPGSAPVESFGGSLTFAFTQDGNPWVSGDAGSPDGFTMSLSGFFQYSAPGLTGVDIQGSVKLSVASGGVTVDLSGDVNVGFLGDLGDATGEFVLLYSGSTYTDSTGTTSSFVNNSGNLEIYGALELSTGAAFSKLENYGLMVNGAALFQVNTTGHNVLVNLPPPPSAPNGTAATPFVIQSSVLFDMTITGTSSAYATISYQVGGNQLFQMQGFFDLRITDDGGNLGAQMFADINSLTLGPSGATFLSFSGFGLFVINSQGFAAEINLTLGTGGSAISGISFNASFQLVINTTSQAITFTVPSVTVPTSSSGSTSTAGITVYDPTTGAVVGTVTSLVIPAGPPQGWLEDIGGAGTFASSGAAGPYIVVTGVGSLNMEGLALNGFFYFQISSSPSTGVIVALVVNVNGNIPGVGSASVEGALQISSAGEVALLAISGSGGGSTNYGSGVSLQLSAELALNTTSSPVSSIGGVPLTSPSGSHVTIAANTYAIIASGTLTLNVGGNTGFVISGVFSTTVSTSSGITTTTITLTGTLTATVDGSTLLTMGANGVLVATSGGATPGMAGELTLTLSGSNPLDGNGFSFNGSFSLIVNTTGAQQTVSVNGMNTIISAGPDSTTTGTPYVEIDASGSMIFGTSDNGFLLNNGNFYLSVSSEGIAVSASATMVVEVGDVQLFSVAASGAMLVTSDGFAASLTVTSDLTDPNGMYSFNGTFTLQANTTGAQQTIGTVVIPAGPGANATPGPYFQLYGTATLALGTTTADTGIFLDGTFYMLIGSNGLTVSANGNLTAEVDGSTLLSMQATGALIIVSSGNNPGMAGELTLTRSGSSPLDSSVSSFNGTFTLEVNTTGIQQIVPLGNSSITITAGPDNSTTADPYVEVDASGTLTFGTAQNGFVLTGDFFLSIGETGLDASANVSMTAAVGGVTLLTMNATGILVIAAGANPGIAADLSLTLTSANPLDGNGFSFNGSFNMEVNTTGVQQVVPLGNSTATITAGPNGASALASAGPYFEIDASGSMVFGTATNGFLLNNGNFYLAIGTTGFAVSAGATMVIEVNSTQLFSSVASGAMLISSQGFAASLTVASNMTVTGVYDFEGTFTLQVNTTGVQQTIGSVVIPAGPGASGSPSGPYFQMYVSATLGLGSTTDDTGVFLNGNFYLVISSSGLMVAANGTLTAEVSGTNLLTMTATGVLVISVGANEGIAGELTLTLTSGDPFDGSGFSFNGSFVLEVNTTDVQQVVPIGSTTTTITAGPNGSTSGSSYVEVYAHGALILGTKSNGFALTGDFFLAIGTDGLYVSTNVSFTASIGGSTLFALGASGVMEVTSSGLAASFTLTASGGGNPTFGMSNAFSFNGEFLFQINTTNNAVDTTIGNTPLNLPSGFYFEIAITGISPNPNATLTIGAANSGIQLSGNFDLTITSAGIMVTAQATLSIVVDGFTFFSLAANGALLINSNGIAASITLGANGTIPTGTGFSFAGLTFIFEVNTTGSAVTTINNQVVNLPASSAFFEVAASGELQLAGVVNVFGSFVFTINGANMQIAVNASLGVFGINFSVNGFAQLSSAGLVLGVNLFLGSSTNPTVTFIPGVLALSGIFTLEINTTGSDINVNVAGTNYDILAGTKFKIHANVSFNVLGYSLGSTQLDINVANVSGKPVFSVSGSLSFNFFGFVTFTVSFYFDSNDEYWFYGYTYVQLGSGSFNIHGSLTLEFASYDVSQNPGKYGSPTAQGTTFEIAIDGGVTAFGWDFASIGASISDSNNYVYFSVYVSVSFFFFSIGGTVTINLGAISPLPAPPPPPALGTVLSAPTTIDGQTFGTGTLLLNLGTYAEANLGMTPLPDETYTINVLGQNSDGTYNVEVTETQLYSGPEEYGNGPDYGGLVGGTNNGTVEYVEVTGIVVPNADTSTGTTNVTLNITGSGAAPVTIFSGSGTNSYTTGAGATTIHGTVGRDTIVGGTGNVTFYAGTGVSSFTGGGNGSTHNTINDPGTVSLFESGYSTYSLVGSTATTATLTYGGNTDQLSGSNIVVTLTAPSSGSSSFQVTNYTGNVTLDANGNSSVTTTITVSTGHLTLANNLVTESNGITGIITLKNGGGAYGSLTLAGSAANVTLTLTSWSGTGAVALKGVNDIYVVDFQPTGSLAVNVTDTGTTGSLTINATSANNAYNITNTQVALVSPAETVGYTGLQTLILNARNGNDTVNIASIVNATTVNLGTGANMVTVQNGNKLSGIKGLLTVNGSSQGKNTLVVNDSADTALNETMTLTGSTLSGGAFGAGGSLAYANIGTFTLSLANPGSGKTGNTMNIQGMSGVVTINLGNGNNIVNLGSTGGSGTLGGGTSSLTSVQGSLTLNGSGNDTMNVDDSGSSTAEQGILQPGSLSFSDPLAIQFNGFTAMTIYLSKASDVFAVVDTFSSASVTPVISLNGVAGNDVFDLFNNHAPMVVNGGSGSSSIYVFANASPLILNGGTGVGAFYIFASVSGASYLDNATVTITGGSGETANNPNTLSIFGTPLADTFNITGALSFTNNSLGLNVTFNNIQDWTLEGLGGNNIFNVTAVPIPTTLVGDGSVPQLTVPAGLPNGLPPAIAVGTPGLNLFYVGWQGQTYIPGTLTGINAPLTLSEGSAGTATAFIDDSSDIYGENYTLTPTTLVSSDMGTGGEIIYDSSIDNLDLILGSGQNNVTVNGTGAGVQTVINGGAGDDAVTVNGSPNLMTSPLVVIGGSNNLPGNTLTVNGATTGTNFVITASTITGLGSMIQYESVQTITINAIGGNNTFTVNSDSVPTYLFGANGNDAFTINSSVGPLYITGGTATNKTDTFAINANSGILTITGGAGLNNFTITGNGGNLTISGSGKGNTYLVNGNGGQLTLNGSSTTDSFTVNAIGTPATINGGTGIETITVNAPLASTLTVIGGSNPVDSLTINGISGNDYFIITGTTVSGVGSPINYSQLGSLTVNGGVGINTFQIDSDSVKTTVNGSVGNDTFYILTAGAPTTVNTNGGINTIDIGSNVPTPNSSVLFRIQGAVTINGSGNDILNIDDSDDVISENGTLTSSALTGFGMGAGGITYNGIVSLNLTLGFGQATLNIRSTNAATTTYINTGTGIDTINIGSVAPSNGGLLSGIQGVLTIVGGGSDIMNVDDTGDATAQSGVLTPTTLNGLGMAATGIVFSGFAKLTISLGFGGNTFTIENTNAATATMINDGLSDDTINLIADSSVTTLNGQAGDDTFNILSTNGTTTINTGTGTSVINVGSLAPNTGGVLNTIQGALIVSGDGRDTLNVDDTGDALSQSATLTATTLTGMGMAGITYSGLAALNVNMGTGGNSLTVTSVTDTTVTTINGGTGANSATMNFGGDFAGNLTLINFATATLAVAGDFSGLLNDAGTITTAAIEGSFTSAGILNAGSIATMTVGDNMAGLINVTNLLGTLTVDGGTPGQIIAGNINVITVLAGFGNIVFNVTEAGVQREIFAAPLAGGAFPDTTFAFVYDSQTASVPQVAIRITNSDPIAHSFNLELVVINNSTAQFNLTLVDSYLNGSSGVGNISVQGSLLTKLTVPELDLFTDLTASSKGGVVLPSDSIIGVEVSGSITEGYINVAGIEGLAFAVLDNASGKAISVSNPLGSASNIKTLWNLLGSDAVLNSATDTFVIPFSVTQGVKLYASVGPAPDMQLVMTLTDSISGSLPITAYVQIIPATTKNVNPFVESVALIGSGASILSRYSIANITSTGSIGSITISKLSGATMDNAVGLGNVTAAAIFGDIDVASGGIYGVIQTTVGDIGQFVLNSKGQITGVTSIISVGSITGQIISRGNIISSISTNGSFSGVIAAQGNLGAILLNSNGTAALKKNALTQYGGITIKGADSGQIIAPGNAFGTWTISGSMTGRIAVEGQAISGLAASRIGFLGKLTIKTFALGGAIISGGLLGDKAGGTTFTLGKGKGFVAVAGAANLKSTTLAAGNLIVSATGANLSAITDIFTDNDSPLRFDTGGNLAGLALIETDLATIQDNSGVLSGTIP